MSTSTIIPGRFQEFLRRAKDEAQFLAQPGTERTRATLELVKLFDSKGFLTSNPKHPKFDRALRRYMTLIAHRHYDTDYHALQPNVQYNMEYFEFGIRVGIVGILEYLHVTVPYYEFNADQREMYNIADSLLFTFQNLRDPNNYTLYNLQHVRDHEERMLPLIQHHLEYLRHMDNIHFLEQISTRAPPASGRASGGGYHGSAASQVLGNLGLLGHIGHVSQNLGRPGTF